MKEDADAASGLEIGLMMNEVQIIQVGISYAREMEHFRKVNRLLAQRLENNSWGLQIEGITKQSEERTIRLRIESNGSLFKL